MLLLEVSLILDAVSDRLGQLLGPVPKARGCSLRLIDHARVYMLLGTLDAVELLAEHDGRCQEP
eukprot:6139568-Pyramimonas_sp.AAC.1